jgi:uncharacterized protein YraI
MVANPSQIWAASRRLAAIARNEGQTMISRRRFAFSIASLALVVNAGAARADMPPPDRFRRHEPPAPPPQLPKPSDTQPPPDPQAPPVPPPR